MRYGLGTFLAQVVIHEISHLGAVKNKIVDYTDGPASAVGGAYIELFDISAYGYPSNPSNFYEKLSLKNYKP